MSIFYVKYMTIANNDPSYFIVHMDKNCIHNIYSRYNYTLFYPNNDQEVYVKYQHKRKHLFFVAIIY